METKMDAIYFDHAATTPLDERVLDAMLPWLKQEFGNANSMHQMGQRAKVALEEARDSIASLLHVEPSEVIFTSGGTESNNGSIRGVFEVAGDKNEIITSRIEHHAVLHTIESLKRHGARPVYLEPDSEGRIHPDQVREVISDRTALVSLMHVNNEIGSVNPLAEIAEICRENSVPFHSDCVQSVGKIPVDVDELGLDLMSLSGHKLYGPKGVGVMIVRSSTPWIPTLTGGSQERRRRGGTSNIPGIVGLQKAMELRIAEMDSHLTHVGELRRRMLNQLEKAFGGQVQTNGPSDGGVPHILNIGIKNDSNSVIDSEMLLLNLDIEDVCVSNGSACTSGAVEPSHVLTGIGLDDKVANASLRISFGKDNTLEQVDAFIPKLKRVLDRMLAPA